MGEAKRRKQLDPNYGQKSGNWADIAKLCVGTNIPTGAVRQIASMIDQNMKSNKIALIDYQKERPLVGFIRDYQSLDDYPKQDQIKTAIDEAKESNARVLLLIHSSQGYAQSRVMLLPA